MKTCILIVFLFAASAHATCMIGGSSTIDTHAVFKCATTIQNAGFYLTVYEGSDGEKCGYLATKDTRGGAEISYVKIKNVSPKKSKFMAQSVVEFLGFYDKVQIQRSTVVWSTLKENLKYGLKVTYKKFSRRNQISNGQLDIQNSDDKFKPMYCEFANQQKANQLVSRASSVAI